MSQLGTGEARICLLPELSLLLSQTRQSPAADHRRRSACRLRRRRSVRLEVLPAGSPPERTAPAGRAWAADLGHSRAARFAFAAFGRRIPASQPNPHKPRKSARERYFTGFRTGSVDGVLGRCRIRVAHLSRRHTFAASEPVRIPVGSSVCGPACTRTELQRLEESDRRGVVLF